MIFSILPNITESTQKIDPDCQCTYLTINSIQIWYLFIFIKYLIISIQLWYSCFRFLTVVVNFVKCSMWVKVGWWALIHFCLVKIVKCNGRSKKVFDDKQFWTFLLLGVGCPQKLHNMPSCHLLARFTFPSRFRELLQMKLDVFSQFCLLQNAVGVTIENWTNQKLEFPEDFISEGARDIWYKPLEVRWRNIFWCF